MTRSSLGVLLLSKAKADWMTRALGNISTSISLTMTTTQITSFRLHRQAESFVFNTLTHFYCGAFNKFIVICHSFTFETFCSNILERLNYYCKWNTLFRCALGFILKWFCKFQKMVVYISSSPSAHEYTSIYCCHQPPCQHPWIPLIVLRCASSEADKKCWMRIQKVTRVAVFFIRVDIKFKN